MLAFSFEHLRMLITVVKGRHEKVSEMAGRKDQVPGPGKGQRVQLHGAAQSLTPYVATLRHGSCPERLEDDAARDPRSDRTIPGGPTYQRHVRTGTVD
jgi:hypothetical protein